MVEKLKNLTQDGPAGIIKQKLTVPDGPLSSSTSMPAVTFRSDDSGLDDHTETEKRIELIYFDYLIFKRKNGRIKKNYFMD
ncbi:MAG: hypothetical protein PVI26_04065 [Chitinispirillia bacterium]|jgi:hypothetical protein